ncbi:MAG: tRNA (N6-isopentenyl adenosine(37)-C2)-methylthiotransferase MiaB [Planctomycetes bacterium]|nr:tRNA (N6-isopentenyl adenosine(37)-C2)-methylthiotransferase MiaB [Planctomycetota bacterium]
MEPARIHITTYGCQMNRLDSELVQEVLLAAGAEVVDDPARANVLLFITCAVRAHAEDRVFSNIGKLAARKRRQPGLVVGLLGCMAQEHGPAVRRRAPLVDLVCAPGRLADLPDLIAAARAGRPAAALDPSRDASGAAAFAASDAALDAAEIRRTLGPAVPGQAYVVAMRGCDNFCSYCVVPFVRGPERSREPAAVLEEVRRLVGQGARQITLLGQAVNQYAAAQGRDREGAASWRAGRRWDLADLIEKAADTPGLSRLYFITNHPKAFQERLARVFRDVPHVCPYLHMPAQSGADAVLERMNRGYTAAEYLDRVAMVRSARPDVAVASDFIVGFPGETEADFAATCDLVRRVRFSGAFVFKYSPRPATPAARRWADDVPDAEKRRRHGALLALVESIAAEENQAFVGRTVRVFVEELSPRGGQARRLNGRGTSSANPQSATGNPQLRGRTPCRRIVVFDGPPTLVGGETGVQIHRATALTLFGTMQKT